MTVKKETAMQTQNSKKPFPQSTTSMPKKPEAPPKAAASTKSTPANAVPRYRASQPVKRGDDRTFWRPVGVAFPNAGKNGSTPSISVRLDSLPLSGEVVLFADDDHPPTEAVYERYRAAVPIETDGERPVWHGIGAAFLNPGREGKAATIKIILDALPPSGEFLLFPVTDEKSESED